jgi:hypothetical protein
MKTKLQGKTITSIFVSQGESTLCFCLSDGTRVLWDTDGDCCSESWFADIIGVDALIGGTVASIEELPDVDNPQDNRSRQDVDTVYGYDVTTNKGRATVAFRNSSNGHYGGSMTEGIPTDADTVGWKQITEDWSA